MFLNYFFITCQQLVDATLMKKQSIRDVGTLKFFRERIMRYNVYSDVKKDVDAYQDFFLSEGRVYLAEAFIEFFGMESVDAQPTKYIPPQTQSRAARRRVFHTTFAEFVDKFVLQLDIEAIQAQPEDRVMNCGLCIIEFTVLLLQMIDTVHEGDGDRLIVNLKYLLLIFKAKSSYSKYAVEVMRFLSQVNCTLTEQMAKRVVYGRFFNTAGKQGRNIESDLAMEHTIKATKNLVNAMGAKKKKKAVQRATRAVYSGNEHLKETQSASKLEETSKETSLE